MYDVDILMIGHFAKDRLVVDGTSEIASSGAVYYGGVALRRIGVRVAVVTRLHPDDFSLLSQMEAEGVSFRHTHARDVRHREHLHYGRYGAAHRTSNWCLSVMGGLLEPIG